jgi:hypothetical protein
MFMIVYYSFSGSEAVQVFKCLFTSSCIVVGDSNTKRRRVGKPLIGLTPPYFCVSPNPRHEFPIPYIVVVYLKLDVVVRFINISGIVDHHCLIYLCIKAILILPLGVKKTKVFDLI